MPKHTQDIASISIQQFVATIFQGFEPEQETPCLARRPPDGGPWYQFEPGMLNGEIGNLFFCITSVTPTHRDRLKRRQIDAVMIYALVFDDIGTKSKEPLLPLSWKLETSPGNFQGGLFLEPTSNFDLFLRTMAVLAEAGYTDPGSCDLMRCVRVPGSVNHKNGFEARLVEWNPDVCYALEEIAPAFGLDPAKAPPPKQRARLEALDAGLVVADPVARWLLEQKLVIADKGEWLDVVCPWSCDHSDDRVEAGYSPLGRGGTRGFKCHHSHPHGTREFLAWVKEQGGPDAAAADTAAPWRAAVAEGLPDALLKLVPTLEQHQERVRLEAEQRREYARNQARAEARKLGDGEIDPTIEPLTLAEMNERLVLITGGSYILDRRHPGYTLKLADARVKYAACTTLVGEKRIRTLELWLMGAGKLARTVQTFNPAVGEFCFSPDGIDAVNTWRAFPRAPGAEVERVLDHIRYLFGDRAEEFLDWLAHLEQHPGVLPHTAWVHISSRTGTGRGLLANLLARVWARHTALSVDLTRLLDSSFNGRLAHKLLAVVDEIKEGGEDRWKHSERLKQMVTEPVRVINRKYGAESVEVNCCRWLVFSNHRTALPIEESDRRFEIAICDALPRDRDYYDALVAATEDPAVVAGFAWFLRERDLTRFNPGRHSSHTSARAQVVIATRPTIDQNIIDHLAANPRDLFHAVELQQVAGITMSSGKGPNLLAAALGRCGLLKRGRARLGGRQVTIYCRQERFDAWDGKLSEITELDCPAPRGTGVTQE